MSAIVVIDEVKVGAVIDVLRVEAGDTVIVKLDREIGQAEAADIHAQVGRLLPAGVTAMVLTPGIELEVVRGAR